MRDYGKVYGTFWTSETTGRLSDDGKLLALYLMTTTHATISGVFRMPDGYVSEDLNWPVERVKQGFQELSEKGFATRCEDTKWAWVIKHLEWNPPENPNQIKGARKIALAVPDSCTWKQAFMRAVGAALAIELPAAVNPSQTLDEGLRNQEQKTEGRKQEQKAGTEVGAATPPPAPTPAPPANASAAATADTKSPRGTRLSKDWLLPKPWGIWAQEKYPHWNADTVRAIASNFKNHWTEKTGRDATKITWQGTWENWCDSDITQRQYPPPKTVGAGAIAAQAQAAESIAKSERIKTALLAGGGAVMPAATLNNTVDMPS